MEIDHATAYMLNALSVDQRTLARGLTQHEQYDFKPGTVWWRAPSLNLVEIINEVRSRAKKDHGMRVDFINLYCDTLVIEDGAIISPEPEKGTEKMSDLVLEIFTRKIQSSNPEKTPSLSFVMTKMSNLTIWTTSIPKTFVIYFTGMTEQPTPYKPQISREKFGISMFRSDSEREIESTQYLAPVDAMLNINYLDLIDDNGNVVAQKYLNDDLPRLLQLQVLVAQAHAKRNRKLAIELLYFVIAATNTKHSVYMNLQANTMLSNLLLDEGVLSVPSVNVYSAKTILKSRLVAAMAFEQAFTSFRNASGNLEIQTMTAMNALAKSQDAIRAYEFQRALKQDEYTNATKANKLASEKLDQSRFQLDKLGENFDRGIQAWVRKEKEAAAKEIFIQFLVAAAAIGATVATGGLAAPLAGMSLGALAKGVSSVAKVFQMLKQFYDKIKELLKKLEPVIKKIKELVNMVSTVIKKLKDFKKATGESSTLRPDITLTDPINATAEYDHFGLTVQELEEGMRDYHNISGKVEYFTGLKGMVIDGKAAIATQANLVQKGNELAIVLVQKEVELRDEKRLGAATETVSKDKLVAEVLMRAMFDRVLSIRSLVYLDFFTFMIAYRYHTLSDDEIVTLSPVKPVVDYLEDMAALQGAIASYGSRELVQQRTFRLNTLCGYDTVQELGSALTSGRAIKLVLSPDETIWKGFGRIRMSTARCYLDGVTLHSSTANGISEGSTASPNLRLELSTSRQFFDRSSASVAPRAFIGDGRTVLFEYSPATGAVSCDGSYGQERDYAKQTPMTTWSIRLLGKDDGSDESIALTDLDFTKFTGLKVEFVCEFLWLGAE